MEQFSLVDLNGLSKSIVKLIECVSNAIGVVYEPTRIRRKAHADAHAALLKAQVDGIISDIEYRSMVRLVEKETRRQQNIENIVSGAAEILRDMPSNEGKPDEDWIADFFDLCQNCSSEMMQRLWASLLAGEVDSPGTFSRRTMHSVKLLSVPEAHLFTTLCGCIWKVSEESAGAGYMLIMDSDSSGRYSDETWGFDGSDIPVMEMLNLCSYQFFDLDVRKEYCVKFGDESYTIKPKTDSERLEVVALSPVGVELYPICGSILNYEYCAITVDYLRERGLITD